MTPPGPRPAPLLAVAVACWALLAAGAIVVAVRHGAPLGPEVAAHDWSVAHHGEPLRSLARALTATGSGPVPYAMAVLAGLLAAHGTSARLRTVLGALLVLVAGEAIRYGLMELLARPRPPDADHLAPATGHAFPSGHATTAALAAGLLAWGVLHRARPSTARTWCAVLAVWAAGVGLTRIYLGVHWPGDVLAGWLLAAAVLTTALLVTSLIRARRPTAPSRRVPSRRVP